MNKKTTWRRVLSVLCVAVMLLGMTFAGTLVASAEETVVAKIGDVEYTSLQAAINAAVAGTTTIELVADCDENVTITQAKDKNIVIDGNGKNYTGTATVNGNGRSTGAETLTFQNINFVLTTQWDVGIATVKSKYAHKITVKDCTFTATGDAVHQSYGVYLRHAYDIVLTGVTANDLFDVVYGNSAVTRLTVENTTVTNCNYGFYLPYGTGAINLTNVEIDATVSSLYIDNRNTATVTFTNCELNGKVEFAQQSTKTVTLVFEDTSANIKVTSPDNKAVVKVNTENSNLTLAEGTDVAVLDLAGEPVAPNADGSYGVVTMVPIAEVNGVQYESIQAAIDAAQDGATVVVLADHIMNLIDRDHFIAVEGNKSVTLDLNGKVVTCDSTDIMQATDYIRVIHVLEGSSLVIEDSVGTGKVLAFGENSKLAYMFGNDGNLVINGGDFELSAIKYGAMFFSKNSNMTVAGGNFVQNTWGWMFNTMNNGDFVITVTGGTFNRDFLTTYKNEAGDWSENTYNEVVVAEGYQLVNNGNGTWSVVDAATPVAKIGDVEYTDLQAAIDAAVNGDTIVLIDNINLNGSTAFNGGEFGYNVLFLVDGKQITIDFAGYYINVTTDEIGDCDPLTSKTGVKYLVAVIFSNNGANLTLKGEGGIKVTETNLKMYDLIYNNDSTLVIEGGEYVSAVQDCLVYGDGTHSTTIAGGNFTITNLGSFNADGTQNKPWISNTQGKNASFVVYTGGTFNQNPTVNFVDSSNFDKEVRLPAGYIVVDNGNGTWSVVKNAAKIGDVYYTTLAEAIAAVQNGETIVLVADNAEKVTIKQVSGKSFTIDGAGFTFTGKFTIDGNKRRTGAETLTFCNFNFVTSGSNITIEAASGTSAHNVTICDSTCVGVNSALYTIKVANALNFTLKNIVAENMNELFYANKAIEGLTVENVEINNCYYGFYMSYGTKISFTNVKSNGTTGNAFLVYKNNSGNQTINFTNCELDAPIAILPANTSNVVTVALNGTTFTTESWLNISGTGATVKVAFDNAPALSGATYDAEYYNALAGANLYVFSKTTINFVSSQLNLGNSFGIYFNVNSAALVAGVDYVAVVTDANGNVVAEIPSSMWVNGNQILFSGLAAKQMADEFTVVVKSAGQVVSASVTESIKSYVERGRAGNLFDAETLNLLTAMLNYGAAAQDSFNYNEENLANTVVADREVVNVDIVNNTNAGDDYYGASLNLNSNICFNFKFLKEEVSGNVVEAYVKYVDKNGENVCVVVVPVLEEITTKFPKDLYVVKFDTIIPADAAQVFTCELIDENGNVVATAQDSVLSYCARAIAGLQAMDPADYNGRQFKIEFYQAVANYIVAVSNYTK